MLRRELDLSECRGVSGSALQGILTGALPALESVMLTGIPEVSNSLLAEMGLGLPLRHISVAKCTAIGDQGLRGLAAASPQLLTLRADQCTKITDDGVVALAESCKELQVNLLCTAMYVDLLASMLLLAEAVQRCICLADQFQVCCFCQHKYDKVLLASDVCRVVSHESFMCAGVVPAWLLKGV